MALGTAAFDRFTRGLDYPMFVVTTRHGGERAGCPVGFTTQASIDPARLLVQVGFLVEPVRVDGFEPTPSIGYADVEDVEAGHPA